MRTVIGPLAALYLAIIATAAGAQDTGRTPPSSPKPAHDTMLLTGCLVAGPDETTFKLTKASRIESPAAAPNAQGAPAAPVATAGERSEYDLKAEARLDAARVSPIDMKALVGRQVQVTTRPVEESAPPEPARPSGEAKPDPEPGKTLDKTLETKKTEVLTVTDIKQLAATCQ
jgi:hypothetical protein